MKKKSPTRAVEYKHRSKVSGMNMVTRFAIVAVYLRGIPNGEKAHCIQ